MPASYTIRRSVPRNTRRSKPASTPSTCFPSFSINLFMAFPLPRGDLSSNTTNIIREQKTPSPFGCGYAALCPTVTTCTASTTGAAVTIYVYDPIGNLAQEYGPPAATGTEYLVPDVLGSVGFIGFALGSTGLVTDSRILYNPAGQ